MEAGGSPPSALTRRITFIALTLVVLWWCALFVFAVLAAWALAAAEWEAPSLSKYVAPALAILAAGGAMAWLRRDRVSFGPVWVTAALVVLTVPLTFSIYGFLLLRVLFSAMSADPGG